MRQIFISYSWRDKIFAYWLENKLLETGAKVWIDKTRARNGERWSDEIQLGLDESSVMLLIISPDSMASENVKDEWQYFHEQRKTIIPIKLRTAKVHYQLARRLYIDFENTDRDFAFEELHSTLQSVGLGLNTARRTEPGPDRKPHQPLPIDISTFTHVFISYSTGNRSYIEALAENFVERGFDIWVDTDKLKSNKRRRYDEVAKGIRACRAFVIVMSPEANQSRNVRQEVLLAQRLGKPIFALLLAGEYWDGFDEASLLDIRRIHPISGHRIDYSGAFPTDLFCNAISHYAPRRSGLRGANMLRRTIDTELDRLTQQSADLIRNAVDDDSGAIPPVILNEEAETVLAIQLPPLPPDDDTIEVPELTPQQVSSPYPPSTPLADVDTNEAYYGASSGVGVLDEPIAHYSVSVADTQPASTPKPRKQQTASQSKTFSFLTYRRVLVASVAVLVGIVLAAIGVSSSQNTDETPEPTINTILVAQQQTHTAEAALPVVATTQPPIILTTVVPSITDTVAPSPTETVTQTASDTPSTTPLPTIAPTTEIAKIGGAISLPTEMPPLVAMAYTHSAETAQVQTAIANAYITETQRATETQVAAATQIGETWVAFNATQTIEAITDTPTPTPEPGYPGGTDILSNGQWQPQVRSLNGIDMVIVPNGCFFMGENGIFGSYCFKAFLLDRTEVTRSMYSICDEDGDCFPVPPNQFSSDPQHPITGITLEQAQTYCAWRGARLPTEAEWEYAARGPNGLLYPWGSTFDPSKLFFGQPPQAIAQPAGSQVGDMTWVGAFDMAGNALEWTSSPFDAADTLGTVRVVRGATLFDIATTFKLTRRTHWDILARPLDKTLGFRCARDFPAGG